jgi:hypothetical protein
MVEVHEENDQRILIYNQEQFTETFEFGKLYIFFFNLDLELSVMTHHRRFKYIER